MWIIKIQYKGLIYSSTKLLLYVCAFKFQKDVDCEKSISPLLYEYIYSMYTFIAV